MRTDYAAPLPAYDDLRTVRDDGIFGGGVEFEAVKKIDAADPYLPGHYPGFVIYPGVFSVETVHQAARRAAAERVGDSERVELTAIESVRFSALVLPGDTLRASGTLTAVDSDPGQIRVKAVCERGDGTRTGSITLRLRVRPGSGGTTGPAAAEHGTEPTRTPGAGALDAAAVAALLPHRHPIVQVDQVLEVDPGRSIVATKAVTLAEPCYAHVPAGAPVDDYAYPLTLLFESMGQAGGVLWLNSDLGDASDDEALIFGAARNCRLLGPAYPGDVLRHVVRTEMVKGANAVMSGETWVNDRCVATVDSMLAVVRPRAELTAP